MKNTQNMNKEHTRLEQQHRRVLALCKETGLVTTGIEGVRNFYQKNETLKGKPGYAELREMLNKGFIYYKATRQ